MIHVSFRVLRAFLQPPDADVIQPGGPNEHDACAVALEVDPMRVEGRCAVYRACDAVQVSEELEV